MDLAKSISLEAIPIKELDAEPEVKPPKMSFCKKCRVVFGNITVEPIMVCYILPNVMSSIAMQNLNLEKACRVDLGYEAEICDAMAMRNLTGYAHTEEEAVQKLVATAMACKNVIQSLLPAMLLLFLGSWSDRHNRRKPCFLMPIVGEIVTATGFLLCTYFFYDLSIVYNVIAEAVPPSLTGGWFSMFMGIFSYISGVSSVETRTLRIGAVNLLSNLSMTIGIALSGILYAGIGFYGVFSLALASYCIGLTYGLLRIKEIPHDKEIELVEVHQIKEGEDQKAIKPTRELGFFEDFFDFKHITDTFAVAFKEGERNRKKRICTIMILVMVIIGPMHGELNVMYLFVRYRFGWNEMDYSLYSTFTFLAHLAGTIFSLLVLSKYLQMDDALVGLISSMSKILSSFVYAFAPTSTIFYLGAIVEMLNGTSFIAMRSIISKLVPRDELGKINSLFGVSEALMPLIYGPMYSIIYKSTISYMPGAFFLAGGGLTIPSVLIFLWLYKEHRRDAREELLKAEEEKLLKDKEKDNEKQSQSRRTSISQK